MKIMRVDRKGWWFWLIAMMSGLCGAITSLIGSVLVLLEAPPEETLPYLGAGIVLLANSLILNALMSRVYKHRDIRNLPRV